MSAQGRVTRLPPRHERRVDQYADVEVLAWLLDNSIPIPGIGRRVGLDAVIGLVPGLGDLVAGGLGVIIVLRAAQAGVPAVVVARMVANLAFDFAMGAIPFAGDFFDLFFKANAQNIALLRRHLSEPTSPTHRHWFFFAALAVGLVLVCALIAWAVISSVSWLLSLL